MSQISQPALLAAFAYDFLPSRHPQRLQTAPCAKIALHIELTLPSRHCALEARDAGTAARWAMAPAVFSIFRAALQPIA